MTLEEKSELAKSGSQPLPNVGDVIAFTAALDRKDGGRKGPSIATRLHSMILSVQQFAGVVDTFVSSRPEVAALVWGSVKLALMVSWISQIIMAS